MPRSRRIESLHKMQHVRWHALDQQRLGPSRARLSAPAAGHDQIRHHVDLMIEAAIDAAFEKDREPPQGAAR